MNIEIVYAKDTCANSSGYYAATTTSATTLSLEGIQVGDLITVQITAENADPSVSSEGRKLAEYRVSSMGYYSRYTARAEIYEADHSGDYQVSLYAQGKHYSYSVLVWRADKKVRWTPYPATFRNHVLHGTAAILPSTRGILLALAANETWTAEFSWYPIVGGDINVLRNRRCHDVFYIVGTTQGGDVTVTPELLQYADVWGIPVRADPLPSLFSDFFLV